MKGQVVGSILLGLSSFTGLSQTTPESNPGPVQAELLAHLSVHRLAPGNTVFAKVTLDWNGPGCTLRSGAILEATVEAADRRKSTGESKLALSFARAQCNGAEMQPMKLLLAAVAGPPQDWRVAPNPEFRVPMSFLQVSGASPAGFGGSTISNFAMPTMELTGIVHHFPMGPKVKPGAVIDIRGMKLDIGTGPNQCSVLTAKNRDISLEAFTQFLLVPASLTGGHAAAALIASTAPPDANDPPPPMPPRAAPPAPVNDLEVCAPPGCAVDLPVTTKELTNRDGASIPIQPLGYAPRPQKILGDFGNEEMLAWLSPRELLLAFNPHPLIHRSGSLQSGKPHRVIRAVLLDTETHTVVRAVDWEITDTLRYLWPLDGNRILVHVGNELRVYGAGLKMERSILLSGPLAFVRIAPNGELLAMATLRERHSPELHTKLREELGSEPEEDVEVALLDKGFNTIAQTTISSGLQAPTLLNEGQVRLLSQPNMQFRLALNTWDKKSITLARFASRCIPELSSVGPDLLFLLSCDVATGATTYRMLGADGKLLLRGEAGPREIGHEAIGDQKNARFAIKVDRAIRELSPGIEFRTTDLESAEVRVYRASDGKRLLAVRVKDPVASYDSYALSPDGDQLAVLSASEIKFFPVPAE
jgi:hypothetical protein